MCHTTGQFGDRFEWKWKWNEPEVLLKWTISTNLPCMKIWYVNPTLGVGNLLLTRDLMCACSVLLNVRTGGHDCSVSQFVHEYMLFNQTWRRWSWCVYKAEQEKFDFFLVKALTNFYTFTRNFCYYNFQFLTVYKFLYQYSLYTCMAAEDTG